MDKKFYTFTCKQCGKTFEAWTKTRKFCSRLCYIHSLHRDDFIMDTMDNDDERQRLRFSEELEAECGKSVWWAMARKIWMEQTSYVDLFG